MAEEECFRITRQLEKDRQKASPSGTLRASAASQLQRYAFINKDSIPLILTM
jgi:hypothetical protein